MAAREKNISPSQAVFPLIPFKSSSPIMIAGPTNCGKTYWVNKFLTFNMFTEDIAAILYCYGIYQEKFDEMKQNKKIVAPITFKEGLPTKEDLKLFAKRGRFKVLIMDDLMENIVQDPAMQDLFTRQCHHLNISAVFISQNIFQQGKYARTISLNCHLFVLFSNKRDESQVRAFARQTYPENLKGFMLVYKDMMKNPYDYILIDCSPTTPRQIKVRGNIFPGEIPITYKISTD